VTLSEEEQDHLDNLISTLSDPDLGRWYSWESINEIQNKISGYISLLERLQEKREKVSPEGVADD